MYSLNYCLTVCSIVFDWKICAIGNVLKIIWVHAIIFQSWLQLMLGGGKAIYSIEVLSQFKSKIFLCFRKLYFKLSSLGVWTEGPRCLPKLLLSGPKINLALYTIFRESAQFLNIFCCILLGFYVSIVSYREIIPVSFRFSHLIILQCIYTCTHMHIYLCIYDI